jgi:hypothetical protein
MYLMFKLNNSFNLFFRVNLNSFIFTVNLYFIFFNMIIKIFWNVKKIDFLSPNLYLIYFIFFIYFIHKMLIYIIIAFFINLYVFLY